jgi:hypothetical protein
MSCCAARTESAGENGFRVAVSTPSDACAAVLKAVNATRIAKQQAIAHRLKIRFCFIGYLRIVIGMIDTVSYATGEGIMTCSIKDAKNSSFIGKFSKALAFCFFI